MQGRKWHGPRSSSATAGSWRGCASMPGPLLTPPPCPHCQVLCQEEDLSIDYQYWGPRKQTLQRAQGEAHALRQPQAREVEAQHPEEPADFPEATAATRRFAKAQEVAKEAPQVTSAPLRTPTAPGSSGAGAGGGSLQLSIHFCFSGRCRKRSDGQGRHDRFLGGTAGPVPPLWPQRPTDVQ